jgi:hypothetical protein
MRRRVHVLPGVLSVALALGTTGCFTPVPTNLAPGIAGGIKATEVTSYVPQEELKVEFIASGYGGGLGLIGAAVDAGVNSARQKESAALAEKVNSAVEDVDFPGQLWAAVSPVVQETAWLKAGPLKTSAKPAKPVTAQTVAETGVLSLGTDYYLSQNCRVLVVSTGIGLHLQGQPKTLAAANSVLYHSSEIGPKEGNDAIPLWIAENGAAYRAAVTESVAESAKLLRYALAAMGGDPPKPLRPATIKVRLVHGRGDLGIDYGRFKLTGSVLEETADRIVFRTETGGFFFSFPVKGVEFVKR